MESVVCFLNILCHSIILLQDWLLCNAVDMLVSSCENGSIVISEESVERLSPFHNELIYGLLMDYVKWSVCYILQHSLLVWCGSIFDFLIKQWPYYHAMWKTSLVKVLDSLLEKLLWIGPYIFRVSKSMSKLDIQEYLNKIYGVRVTRVNTSNVLGKWMKWIWNE